MIWAMIFALNVFMFGCNLTVAVMSGELTTYTMINIPINIVGAVFSYFGLRRNML